MYDVAGYGRMISDRLRMDAYFEALRRTVNERSVVLDIGTGTGIFALLACRLGARRVFAIEPSDAIQIARENAAANGFTARIDFIQDLSTNVTLPEKANIVVSDLRGVLPHFAKHLPVIRDARQRLLSADAILIPRRDDICAAVVEAPALYRRYIEPWSHNDFGLNLLPGRRSIINAWRKGSVTQEQLLTAAHHLATIDYATNEETDLHSQVDFEVERPGVAHGLSVWFDSVLTDGVFVTNRPGEPELIYGQGFFPLFEPVTLVVGDVVSITLSANLVGEDYIWRWSTRVFSKGDPTGIKADFSQSTFPGTPISAARLHKRSSKYVPRLNEEGEIKSYILSLFNGEMPLDEIARQLLKRFPERFDDFNSAMTEVGRLSQDFSR